ncbi:MAG: tetratricopeptide repeat protein [Gammaproteobacteria bacterium]|nr:tetratricopeptide repeat protein [Gammaproteobacteria bacterium]MDH3380424.1 tetratricopeptide repeat protein [Gammaproteobacteria bacterium]
MGLVSELRRRNVLRMAVLYAVAAWLIMQVAEVVIGLANLPEWIGPTILGLLAVGFPIALILSWFYELTPEGMKLEKDVDAAESITHITGRRLDFVVISMLCAAVVLFAYDKWWTSPPPEQSIAVLPFENMSDDASNEHFSDGISEEILNLLTSVPELQVTSRSSAFSFKGQNVDVPTIAAKLNVAHVLEGSVRKSGNQLRITAQLVEVESDSHLWSNTYDREMKNVFAIQDDIAAAVVNALKTTLTGKTPQAKETSPEAYALYLQARHLIKQRNSQNYDLAETLLKDALSLDPGYAPAWVELADFYMSPAFGGDMSFDENFQRARHAIEQALAIDPEYGAALKAMAKVEMNYEWNFAAANEYLGRALKKSPNDPRFLVLAARLNRVLGRRDEAVQLSRRAVALDPVSPTNRYALGIYLYISNHPQEAIDQLRTALVLSPEMSLVRFDLGMMLLAQGDVEAALAMVEQEYSEGFRLTGRAIVQHALGNVEASEAALHELLAKHEKLFAYQIASIYAFRNEVDKAFFWLERCYDIHDAVNEMLVDPLLRNLHDDPRWEPFLDKMGLPY